MIIISGFVTIVVSIVLMLWIFKMKKDDPFPKYTVIKLLIGGWLSFSISSAITLAVLFAAPMLRLNPVDYIAAWREAAAGNGDSLLALLQQSTPNIWSAFFKSLIIVALVEELLKFVTMRLIARKEGTVVDRFDAVVLCALVGIGFQIFEDIDHFKQINDVYGHSAGDIALKTLAEQLLVTVGSCGYVCRWGGDEFVGVIPGSLEQITFKLQKMGERISQMKIDDRFCMTISAGVADIRMARNAGDIDDIVLCADHALYGAKDGGRNRVCQYQGER